MLTNLFYLARGYGGNPIRMTVHKASDAAEHLAVEAVLGKAAHFQCYIRPDVPHVIHQLGTLALGNEPAAEADQRRRRSGDDHIHLTCTHCCENRSNAEAQVIQHSHDGGLLFHANGWRIQDAFLPPVRRAVCPISRAGNHRHLMPLLKEGLCQHPHAIGAGLCRWIILI